MFYTETTFNARGQLVKECSCAYEYVDLRGVLGRVRHTKDRQVIGIEVVKSHVYGDESFYTTEIVLFGGTRPAKN